MTITGQWGKPDEVLLDIVVDSDGAVRGVVNPGRQDAPIRAGQFDAASGTLRIDGEHTGADGTTSPFRITGRLDGRTLRLKYTFGERSGEQHLIRVGEYRPPRRTLKDRLQPRLADAMRWINARSRPTGDANGRTLRARGESLESITFRDATTADIPALAELHVTTWNATYNTTSGPTIDVRTWQWTGIFAKPDRRDFVLVLEDRGGRLIGFTWGLPRDGDASGFAGELSKIYLRWEYHGLGLGRRMLAETAKRFLDRGISSFMLFAERSNPTIGFYDRMGGERLLDEHGEFHGAYGWRDVRTLLDAHRSDRGIGPS
ncbi:MAG: GNAT family N-acetyltransferase [Gemmatimonadota bacterium]